MVVDGKCFPASDGGLIRDINVLVPRPFMQYISFKEQRRHDLVQEGGVFVLLSSRKIRADLILSHYYIRQEIEQVFDISKNYASLLPLNVESEAAFRGHLLMTFISTVLLQMLQSEIRNSDFSLDRILMSMRTLKAKP